MTLTAAEHKRIHAAALAGAQWFVGSQVRLTKPHWDANHGRLIYTMHLTKKAVDRKPVLGLNWTQARGSFCLLSAWELTGDVRYLQTAIRAMNYVKILQVYDDPANPLRQFAIREQVPQSWECAPRDASEACLGLLFLYRATGDKDCLRRAIDYERWWQTTVKKSNGWPHNFIFFDGRKHDKSERSFQAGSAPIYYYLWKATKKERYRRELLRMADFTLANFLRPDGAITSVVDPHHATASGEVLNDDGLMGALLCAYQASKNKKYLMACLCHAAWIQTAAQFPLPIYSALPCMCTFLIELSAITGDTSHHDWAARMLLKHVLPLQICAPKDPQIHGAFRGEDEPVEWYGPKSAKPTDFVCTRVTAYSTLACFKLLGIVGPYSGSLGWERKRPKLPRSPILPLVDLPTA
ncbi:MAG TPA: hypothetical protein VL860_03215 [Planctomycetota bacterium]|nr:hypothetical protein [Planctomycetota bacterium]